MIDTEFDFDTLPDWQEFMNGLIEEGRDAGAEEWDQPEGSFVTAAVEEFEAAGFEKDDQPWPAVAKLAHILQAREIETLRPA